MAIEIIQQAKLSVSDRAQDITGEAAAAVLIVKTRGRLGYPDVRVTVPVSR